MTSKPVSRTTILRAIPSLPGMVAVVIPAIILYATPSLIVIVGWSLAAPWNFVLPLAGLLFSGAGLTLMAQPITLFATIGQGTLAP